MKTGFALVAALAFGGPASSASDPPASEGQAQAPLRLSEVLDAAGATHPNLEAADRDVDRAAAKRFAARGAWDPVLSVEGTWAPVGYYDNGQLAAQVRQATPFWGVGLYAGYRLGLGEYPEYRRGLETLSAGEVRAGVRVPLWKDGAIDPARAEIRETKAKVRAADCGREATRLEMGNQAARAYWNWVAAGQEVRIQRDLLQVAQTRDAGLREQSDSGALPTIVVVDNERLVLDRQAKLVGAERAFQEAMLDLSLYYRDADFDPVQAPQERVPTAIAPVRVDRGDEVDDVSEALRRRPEICELEAERRAAEVRMRLARNQRAPALDANAWVAQDFGNGPVDLRPTEFAASLRFEMPLALRKARGNYKAAKAEVGRYEAKIRGLIDRIAAEVRQARVDLVAASEQVELAARQVEVARQLAEAEREKFDAGASDLVIVNLRELQAADAERLEVHARAAHQRALADYLTATGRGL